jgi:hypothetical protein
MRPPIIFAFAMAAAPALAQPRLEVPVTITATEAMPTPFCFFFFCGLSLGAVPDGAGGYVPFTNSRVMPDGSLRPYDPAVDGMPGVGAYPALAPMPGPPTAYYVPPPVYHPPRRRSSQMPWQWHDPNPSPEALPDTHERVEPQ